MKILVTGTKGQVSRCLQERAALHDDIELVAVGRPELDLLKPDTVAAVIASHRPDIVVSAAAYTAVDQAEDEPDVAFAVNEIGAGAVAAAAAAIGAPVIHLSTDYVFSGELDRPYTEEDEPDPRSVYGASKLAGEKAVAAANDKHIILRTAWVYSPYGKNFVTTMLKLAETRDEISVVDDQWGNPTSAFDVAEAILRISRSILIHENSSNFGTFHLTGIGNTNWFGFARKVMGIVKANGGAFIDIRPISSVDYPTKARRPRNSCLENKKFSEQFDLKIPKWEYSLINVYAAHSKIHKYVG